MARYPEDHLKVSPASTLPESLPQRTENGPTSDWFFPTPPAPSPLIPIPPPPVSVSLTPPHPTHPWPFPHKGDLGPLAVEQGVVAGREVSILKQGAGLQAVLPQLLKAPT